MSHQTGIKCNDELRSFFANAKDGRIRSVKVVINDNEQLALDSYKETRHSNDWKLDYNDCIIPALDNKMPCYIFYRFDEKTQDTGYTWLFISWSPDFAAVKHKMLYAATKSTLKLEFGAGHIKDELFGTAKEDVSLEGYLKHLKAQLAPKPLTFREEELELLKQSENHTRINVDTKHKTMQGVMFPIDQQALHNLEKFKNGSTNYVQCYIDIENEQILMDNAKDHLNPNEIAKVTPANKGRFHLYRYIHTHDGEKFKNIVFIYSMPGFGSSIKERMLYSSCKNEYLNYLKTTLNLDVCKTLEVDDANEITEALLIDELHPKQATTASKFDKPKGPSSRGPRRITKPANE